jgi:ELWxxDGT repeat protein
MRLRPAFLLVALAGAALAQAQTPYLVGDLFPGPSSSNPRAFTPAGQRMFFLARGPAVGTELWSSAGGPGSAAPLDLTPGPDSFEIIPAFALQEQLVFGMRTSQGIGLFRTDGSLGGTVLVSTEGGAEGVSAVRNGVAVYSGYPGFAYRTDGTPQGTYKLSAPLGLGDIFMKTALNPFLQPFRDGFVVPWFTNDPYLALLTDPSGSVSSYLTPASLRCTQGRAVAERMFLNCYVPPAIDRALWITDGTFSGSRLVKDLPSSIHAGMQDLDGLLYFEMSVGGTSVVWRSDGTSTGTVPLTTVAPTLEGSSVTRGAVAGGVLYFTGFTTATGWEPWRTDGTAAGTFMLGDLSPGIGSSVLIAGFGMAAVGGGVVFQADTPGRGTELWKSDGTPGGTLPLPEVRPGAASSGAEELTVVGSRVYFSASDGVNGREPWAVDLATSAVAVEDTVVQEGDSGLATATFRVSLESASAQPVTVAYATEAGTAQAGSDFVAGSGLLTFAPGELARTVDVAVVGDVADETDESFVLRLSSIGGALLARPRAAAVVLDDDAPRLLVSGGSSLEGDVTGPANPIPFAFTLTTDTGAATTAPVTVRYRALSGSAVAGVDMDEAIGTVTFPLGSASGTTQTANVFTHGDVLDEPNENFLLAVDGQNDAAVSGAPATGVVLDDDGFASAAPTELSHGATVTGDLAPPPGRASDRDYFVLRQEEGSSYEVVVDGVSGDAAPLTVVRVSTSGTTVVQQGQPIGTGGAIALRWQNGVSGPVTGEHIRVESAACGTACGADDRYRIRFYETTLRAPRVNNTGGQVSSVALQNSADAPVAGVVHLRSANGVEQGTHTFTIAARASLVVNTAAILPGFSGSLTVAHEGAYGTLTGKVVTADPATGFSFDTPLTSRPR